MSLRSLLALLGLLALLVFATPVLTPRDVVVMRVAPTGPDVLCSPSFARVVPPDRSRMHARALLDDLAYAAVAAGGAGTALLVSAVALVAGLVGLWFRGFRCGLRRVLVAYGLGVPLGLGLLYYSCFLEGRTIRLGPAASRFVPASLHSQTNRTTGLLGPRQLALWHLERGFRVLNVTDKDSIDGALEARAANPDPAALLVIAGEEWHDHPDLVLVHVKRTRPRGLPIEQLIEGVHTEGGAVFVAHPWAKLDPRRLDEVLAMGADGAEIVNGVIHGGAHVEETVRHRGRTLLGVLDYKFGPHVNAVTLIPRRLARTPNGVVEAIRTRRTEVLYAVPGGAMTGAAWEAATLGNSGAFQGVRSLLETPRARRSVWLCWAAIFALLWWLSSRRPRRRGMQVRTARLLFGASVAVELSLPAFLGWQVREALGPVPVPALLGAGGFAAIFLLAATDVLARAERRRLERET